jgi:NAD(P)-dependent dehydrogenase (short-subunit alcohol dehydrogenase family)
MAYPKVHDKTYADISPERPELSTAGKVVVISGGGIGIGRETVRSFARAGAKHIAIFGRRAAPLAETKAAIEKEFKTTVHTFQADLTDEVAITTVFEAIKTSVGPIDIFVNNAGFLSVPELLASADVAEWMKSYDINIKGTLIAAKAFLANAAPGATFLSANTAAAHAMVVPTLSAYGTSKMALLHLIVYLQTENPSFNFISYHPGVLKTEMNLKASTVMVMECDEMSLPADFVVWLASPEASWLKGRFVWSGWDVKALLAKKEQILAGNDLTIQLAGWP